MKSLNVKINLIIIVTVTVIFLLFGFIEISIDYSELNKKLYIDLSNSAKRLAQQLSIPVFDYNHEQVEKYILTEMQDRNVYKVIVHDAIDNSIIAGKMRDRQWNIKKISLSDNMSSLSNKKLLISLNGENIGAVTVYFTDKFIKEQIVSKILNRITILIFLLIITVITLAIVISIVVVRPITRLENIFQIISQGNLEYPISTTRQDEIGGLARSFANIRDAIYLKMEELRISEERLQSIIDNATAVVYLKDKQGQYILINKQFENLFHITKKEIVGKTDHDIFPKKIADAFRANDLKTLEIKSSIQLEEVAPHDDGDHNYISIKFPLYNSNGEPYGICGIATDITERKQQEAELRHLRNYLSNIIDSMPSVLVGVDAYGKVTQWNKRAEQATGINAIKAHGKNISDVFPQIASEMEKITESIRTGETRQEQKRPYQKGSHTCYEDVTIYPLIANGVEGAVIRIDDVTEKVRMGEMMIQSEKMLSVGGLAAGMAHEINNPLAGMMQTANVITSRLRENIEIPANLHAAEEAGTSMEAIRNFMEARGIFRMLTAINESGSRVASIVDNMLSFARKSEAQISSLNLPDLLDKTLILAETDYDLKRHYDFKNIEIRKKYETDIPPVPCEGAKIQQVLLNILRNGAEAMQDGKTKKPLFIVRARFEKERKMICIELEDNGPGMDETTSKRIFEPFFTTKPVGKGTGLGLSVSYFIITENHNGEMAVESQPGYGTKFIIRLPLGGRKA